MWKWLIGKKKRPTKKQQEMIDYVNYELVSSDDPVREILYVEALDAASKIYYARETLGRSKVQYLLEALRNEIDVILRVMKVTDDRKRN